MKYTVEIYENGRWKLVNEYPSWDAALAAMEDTEQRTGKHCRATSKPL